MARHNGCPECQLIYGAYDTNGGSEQNANGSQRAESSSQSSNASSSQVYNPYYTGRPRTPANGAKHTPIDRQEIIRKIKSRESRSNSPELERPASRSSFRKRKSPAPEKQLAALVTEEPPKTPESTQDNESIGLQIERPRSAFHRGDFRDKEDSTSAFGRFGEPIREEAAPSLSTSPVAPWHPDFPSTALRYARQPPTAPSPPPYLRTTRSRAISQASSFIYKAPTSPLVQASRPDTPEPPQHRSSRSPDKSRRHTFSPQALQRYSSDVECATPARNYNDFQPPTLRVEKTFPYQAHQPRRSLNSFVSLPQTPVRAQRRPSLSESPLHHAAMVGSYEESILRGRMSTTPSRPLNFVAQVGVLGKGDCKPNLRCPPHVTVPFPAVFYSYGPGAKAASALDQPSPYVGLVDLENGLPPPSASPEKRRHRVQAALSDEGSRAASRNRGETSNSDIQTKQRRRQKQKRRSRSPKAPPGGSYRIPQKGQLQIVIKNPNKTAVKLFLVPYDLSDMEPGQKTFIRQRSYSAGPIIDMPITSRTNLGTDRPEASLNATDDPNDRPMLRYLIHLHMCCPSKGRYFLYKSMRVVFANRVPDGKEKLRNEIQLPEPKYSAYKPGRDSNAGIASGATPKDATRRNSAVDMLPPPSPEPPLPRHIRALAQSLPAPDYDQHSTRISFQQPLPYFRNALPTLESRPASRQTSDGMEMDPETPSKTSSLSSPLSNTGSEMRSPPRLDEPFSFERDHSRERKPGSRSESLLSRRLRDLAFQAQAAQSSGGAEM